jgi:hypothetical protein
LLRGSAWVTWASATGSVTSMPMVSPAAMGSRVGKCCGSGESATATASPIALPVVPAITRGAAWNPLLDFTLHCTTTPAAGAVSASAVLSAGSEPLASVQATGVKTWRHSDPLAESFRFDPIVVAA